MTVTEFLAAIANIEHCLGDGEAYYLNVGLKSRPRFDDYAYLPTENFGSATYNASIIRLDKDDFPPVYVPVSEIEWLSLSNGTDPYVP